MLGDPNRKGVVSVDGTMDIRIPYTPSECLELSKQLSGKREKIYILKEELNIQKKQLKKEIEDLERELADDIETLHNEERFVPSAIVKAELSKESKSVTIKYQGKIVRTEAYCENKHKGLFGEITNAAMMSE